MREKKGELLKGRDEAGERRSGRLAGERGSFFFFSSVPMNELHDLNANDFPIVVSLLRDYDCSFFAWRLLYWMVVLPVQIRERWR